MLADQMSMPERLLRPGSFLGLLFSPFAFRPCYGLLKEVSRYHLSGLLNQTWACFRRLKWLLAQVWAKKNDNQRKGIKIGTFKENRMIRTGAVILSLVILTPAAFAGTADKNQARVVKIADLPLQEIRSKVFLSSADTCTVGTVDNLVWQIDSWVVGNELFKAYIDPAIDCPTPYPYTVTEINMPMSFAAATEIYVSVDVEAVDLSVPTCPYPGALLAISSQYQMTVPEPGLYSIWIPLDTPVVVNGPFFAGVYLGNAIEYTAGAAVITDYSPQQCTSYNIWDTTVGFVDLNNNTLYNFPGRLAMFASGIPGGGGGGGDTGQPLPIVNIISHHFRDTLFTADELWAWESSGSNIIDYVVFEYSDGSGFIEIGRDYDASRPLRDGINTTFPGDGYSVPWNFASFSEGLYTIRASAFDTLGRSNTYTTNVYLEPSPPLPRFIKPLNGDEICDTTQLLFTCADENVPSISLFTRTAANTFSSGLDELFQFNLGDNNGNPYDGNLIANGEYGDYYSGPAAAAVALKTWYDRGYTFLFNLPLDTLAEQLAAIFHTRENLGTYDEDLYQGLYDFSLPRGAILKFDYERNPDYYLLRDWLELKQRSVILGLGGQGALWVTLNGFDGWILPDSTFIVSISDPSTGTTSDLIMRSNLGYTEVLHEGFWKKIDIAISIWAKDWVVPVTFSGNDADDSDGWSIDFVPTGLDNGTRLFLLATAIDLTNIKGTQTVLVNYDCRSFYARGDYNNDGVINFVDLTYMINFITQGGPPPVGGAIRADANCDNYVNTADIIYFLNFMFGTADLPCH